MMTTGPVTTDEVLTAHETAEILKVHYKTLLRWAREGKVRSIKRGKLRFFRRSWVEEFLSDERPVAS